VTRRIAHLSYLLTALDGEVDQGEGDDERVEDGENEDQEHYEYVIRK
jgi:hypothetical protein